MFSLMLIVTQEVLLLQVRRPLWVTGTRAVQQHQAAYLHAITAVIVIALRHLHHQRLDLSNPHGQILIPDHISKVIVRFPHWLFWSTMALPRGRRRVEMG